MEQVKYCRDCKHYTELVSLCGHPNNGVNIVTGEVKKVFANVNRNGSTCGMEAKWFEVKDQPVKNVPWWKRWRQE